ncbi:hypothetical protein BH10ACT1_BH10ACT1_12110 [soil metagenome]
MPRPTVTGYCWPQSAEPGESVELHLSATTGTVEIEIARIGATREVVFRADDVAVGDHPVPDTASSEGCGWPSALTVAIEADWASGYYEVLLTGEADGRTATDRAFVVVRPTADSDRTVLLVLGTNTWHAYNDFGGTNLYNGGVKVSRQRPMAAGYLHKPPGLGRRVSSVHPPDPQIAAHIGYLAINRLSQWAGSAGWPNWEQPFVEWAEKEGYQFDVATNSDLDAHPDLLDRYALMLSVGHDEYWSGAERNAVEAFTARGGNVAFLSGNTSFWQVRFEGDDLETMVGYKQTFEQDPVYDTDRIGDLTSIWSDHLIGRPENLMTGVSFARGGYARIGRRVPNGSGGYTIHRPQHWLFEGTGLEYGDLLGAKATVVGYECDGCDFTYRDGLPYPTGSDGTPEDFEILGTSPAASFTRETAARPPKPGHRSELEFHAWRLFGTDEPAALARLANGHAVLGTFATPGGGTVVTSGCTDWAMGLAERDPQVEQVTRNLLARLG